MKVANLIQALQELKQKNPIYDFNHFDLTINDDEIAKLEVKDGYKVNLQSAPSESEGE